MTIVYILAALVLLGVLVFVHECGHFLAARWTGIPVREFGIGFGPVLKKWKSRKHDTEFLLRLIPAGGYCAFYDEDNPEAGKQQDERSFYLYPAWKRLLTVFMGPLMNLMLALAVAFCYYTFAGEVVDAQYGRAVIQEVAHDSPAEKAGLKPGCIIISVNGEDASGITEDGRHRFSVLIGEYREGDEAFEIRYLYRDREETASLIPAFDPENGRMMIGVTYQIEYTPVYQPVSVPRAAQLGAAYCVEAGGAILHSLKQMITTGEGLEDAGGPVRIIQIVTEETKNGGILTYLSLLILISVNLGLINLLPIPGLDGSRILFLLAEAVRRKPISRKIESYIHLSGYGILLLLFLVLTYRDILHLFS